MLGLPHKEIFAMAFFVKWYPYFYHANIRTNWGPLKHILVSPQSHRIHHSPRPEHQDKNFGVIFTIWDRLFGTLYKNYDVYPATGIKEPGFPVEQSVRGVSVLTNYLKQFIFPFQLVYLSFGKKSNNSPVVAGIA